MDLFTYGFMQRALLAALFTGLAAPAVGTYLVQRRMALMGDGIGHVAVTGVALGLITGTSPTWTAVGVAVLGAVLIEVIRERGHTNGDVADAVAHQRHPSLHQVGADGGGGEAGEQGGEQGPLHEAVGEQVHQVRSRGEATCGAWSWRVGCSWCPPASSRGWWWCACGSAYAASCTSWSANGGPS